MGMIAKLMGIIGLVLMMGCAHTRMKLETSQMVKHIGSSTVALVFLDEDGDIRPFCTGVFVGSDVILTAAHCAEGMQEYEQEKRDKKAKENDIPDNEVEKVELEGLPIHYIVENEVAGVGVEPNAWHMSKVFTFDHVHDLALLKTDKKSTPVHDWAKLAPTTPEIGTPVHICGMVKGYYYTYVDGMVSAYRETMPYGEPNGPWIQLSVPVYFGNSGGAAFNEYGEVVGIASRLLRAPNTSLFVHLDAIRAFMKDSKVLQ